MSPGQSPQPCRTMPGLAMAEHGMAGQWVMVIWDMAL